MIFRVFFAAVLLLSVMFGMPAAAAIVGDASVSYSATRTVTVGGKTYTGKVFHMPGVQRHDVDLNGIPIRFVLDVRHKRAIVMLPAVESYLELSLPPLLAELDRRRLERKAVGEERIDGLTATKYRLDYTATDGMRGEGYLWLSRDNILLRLDGRVLRPHHKPLNVSMRLTDLKEGPQPDGLFVIPKGFRQIPAQALDLLLNMRLKKR